jgi:uncharacterized protein YjbI with pentapeptide repeats
MNSAQGPRSGFGIRFSSQSVGWKQAAAGLSLLGLLLPARPGAAQGNPVAVIRQLQARLEAVTQQQRQQMQLLQRLNAEHAATTQRMQRFQSALNAAAAAGDPTAGALRSSTPEAALDKLTTQFSARGRKPTPGAATSTPEITPADLTNAQLLGATLRGAKLARGVLKGADLTKADLRSVVLTGANLQGAKLQGANLTGADLTGADLTNALYDAATRWPVGFDPQKHGALLVQ